MYHFDLGYHFEKGPVYFLRLTAQVFIPLMRFVSEFGFKFSCSLVSSFSWGCWICQFHLCKEVRLPLLPWVSLIWYWTASGPISWSCRIYWLHLYRGVRPPLSECPGYDTKQSDDMALSLEFWGMWSTLSLPLLPGPLLPGVVTPERILSIVQIELFEI